MKPEDTRLKRAGFWLRKLQLELDQQGTPFVELEWPEGVDLWPRHVAWSRIGRILAQYNGRDWTLSLALPDARHFATYADWTECMYGTFWGGHDTSETGSAIWLEKLLRADETPDIDVEALDRIVEKRLTKPGPTKKQVILLWATIIIGFPTFTWTAFAVKSPISAGAVGTLAAGILTWVASSWRIRRRRKKLGYTQKEEGGEPCDSP